MKILILILLVSPFIAKAKTERLSVRPSLVSNLCQMHELYRLEHAPRSRSTRMVLPDRTPSTNEQSPLEFLRNTKKSMQDKEQFVKKFWQSYERQGGSRKNTEKELAEKTRQANEISPTCDLPAADQEQLFNELKP